MNIKETPCPECGYRLKLKTHAHQGQRMICPRCETRLVIINLNPIELDPALSADSAIVAKQKLRRGQALCPECDTTLQLNSHLHQGVRLRCHSCNMLLEVTGTNPLELDIASSAKFKYLHSDAFDEAEPQLAKKTSKARR